MHGAARGGGHACSGLQNTHGRAEKCCGLFAEREREGERETERGAAWPILSIVVLAVVKVNDLSTTTLLSLHCGHVNPPIHLGRDRVDPYSQCQEG